MKLKRLKPRRVKPKTVNTQTQLICRIHGGNVHTIKSDLPSKRKKYPSQKDHYNQFMSRFKQVLKFPPEWFPVAWAALAKRYREKGEDAFISKVEADIINPKKSGALMMGWPALGASTSTNALEQKNRWFTNAILAELRTIEPRAKLPTSICLLVDVLIAIWPSWVAADGDVMENTHRQPTQEDT